MKLKASGVNKAHMVVASNSPDKPCPHIEFDPDDFYDGVVLDMDEAAQINQMLLGLIDYLDDEYEKEIVSVYVQDISERLIAALNED